MTGIPSLYLVDSSAWINVLPVRRPHPALKQRLDALIQEQQVGTAGPIRLELMRGAYNDIELRRVGAILDAAQQLPVEDGHWLAAGQLGFQLRRIGLTVPSVDLLIATVAMTYGATLIHCDRHYGTIARHAPLRTESYV